MAAAMPRGILKGQERFHKKNVKKARLIVRNLSFKVSESQLKDTFGKFGNVVEVNIPIKSDGKKRGFAFVQFDNTKSAIKAINGLNSKNINNRPVAVDFAVCKSLYEANNKQSDLEVVDNDFKPEEKTAEPADSDDDDMHVTEEKKDSGYDSDKKKSDSEDDEDRQSSSESSKDDQSDSEESTKSEKSENGSSDQGEKVEKAATPRKRIKRDPDAGDGRTLFLRNVSFQTQEEDLEELMEEFGEVDYAVLCHDPITDMPKGTGFVRFSTKEASQTCLDKANDDLQGGITLDGRRLSISLALPREEAEKFAKKEPKEGKDNRNLYLSREGLIRQGTQAAEGVSKTDMALRARLEYRKRNALRNLHFFVSRTRLCVHNLPPSYDNIAFKKLFLKAANDRTARITEARVMRDQRGHGKSKGFGFVEFTEHEHALAALRTLNNSPDVFSSQKRPIIEFSIENRNAINTKLKRLEKSKAQSTERKDFGKTKSKQRCAQAMSESTTEKPEVETSFSGFKAKKDVKNMPSHFGPKIRHKKGKPEKQKKPQDIPGKKNQSKTESVAADNPKKSKKKGRRKGKKMERDAQEEKAFQMLVNKYKGNLSTVSDKQKQKWYEAD